MGPRKALAPHRLAGALAKISGHHIKVYSLIKAEIPDRFSE